MRILLAVSSMNLGGAERVASLLSNEWVAEGHRVTLVVTYPGTEPSAYPLDERVQVVYLARLVSPSWPSVARQLVRLVALRRLVQAAAPDLVVSFLTNVNVAVILATRGLRVPVVVAERSFAPRAQLPFGYKACRRITYRFADSVIVQTEDSIPVFAPFVSRDRIHVIPNPVTVPLVDHPPAIHPNETVPSNAKLLLAVGRLGPEKGFDRLIDAFTSIANKHPDWVLVLLGEGGERRNLEEAVARHNLRSRVLLPGSAGNMTAWYRRASLFALTSRFEGFPNVLLEAMAHGVPAVSVDCKTGPRQIMEAFGKGLLVDPETGVPGLSAALSSSMASAESHCSRDESVQIPPAFRLGPVATRWLQTVGASPYRKGNAVSV